MEDRNYSNRELDQFFRAADARADEFHNLLMQRMDVFESNTTTTLQAIRTESKEIKEQTTKTNGRVSGLENWKWFITGGLAILTVLFLPILLLVLQHLI